MSASLAAPIQWRSNSDVLESALFDALLPTDEDGIDPLWEQVRKYVAEFTLRPAKRIRPKLLFLAHGAKAGPAPGLVQFAAGMELLHSFLLIHDDVSDDAAVRRGGQALHVTLRAHGPGDDLAIVAGDHLFARAMELMLTAPLAAAPAATARALAICRRTAVGQYLDLALTGRSLSEVGLFQALKVARLKTADYSFAMPLELGAVLAGASDDVAGLFARIGRAAGLAYQLEDDLLGVFGDDAQAGKSGAADLLERKRTVPVLAAYANALPEERLALEHVTRDGLDGAREIIRRRGGEAVTRRLIARYTANALQLLSKLPRTESTVQLGMLLHGLQGRSK